MDGGVVSADGAAPPGAEEAARPADKDKHLLGFLAADLGTWFFAMLYHVLPRFYHVFTRIIY